VPRQQVKVDGTEFQSGATRYRDIFRAALRNAGYNVADQSDNIFEDQSAANQILVAAIVTEWHASACAPMAGYGNMAAKGKGEMRIDWQIYSSVQRKLLATISTTGSFEKTKAENIGDGEFSTLAFRSNAVNLAQTEEFRRLVARSDAGADKTPSPDMTAPIVLASGSSMPAADAVGSVVAIFTGGGMGSGFLVSSDGYVITNEHVVGGAKEVRIRWSDGFETRGEVIRTHKRRDVALIKTDPHGRAPLALRRQMPRQGDAVIAIGMPLDEKWQGTVTKGIVSASRIYDGYSFIQSDVAVDHGNSGGPLLDDKGQVVGITAWGFKPDDISHNLNFFIPIGDALDFLALKPQS
jgi:S1-C subfamily serine protease